MPEHSALIAVLLMDRPMCLDCIAAKSALRVAEVEQYLTLMGSAVEVQRDDHDRCRVCGTHGLVFSVHR